MKAKIKKIISTILIATILFSLIAIAPFSVNAATRTRDEAVAWTNAQIGRYVGANKQCVDLIKAYYNYLGVASVSGDGCDYATNKLPNDRWTRIPKTGSFVPNPGDVVVWNSSVGGGHGHVAIFLSGDTSSFVSVDQNWPRGSVCKKVTHNYNGVWGVIRPDFLSYTPPTSDTIYHIDSPNSGKYNLDNHIELSGWVASNYSGSITYVMCEIDGYPEQICCTPVDSPSEAASYPNYRQFKRFRSVIDKNKLQENKTYSYRIWSDVPGSYSGTFSTGSRPAVSSGTIIHVDSPNSGRYNLDNHIELSGWIASNYSGGVGYVMCQIEGYPEQLNCNLSDSPSEAGAYPNHKYFKRFRSVLDKNKLPENKTLSYHIWTNESGAYYDGTFSTGSRPVDRNTIIEIWVENNNNVVESGTTRQNYFFDYKLYDENTGDLFDSYQSCNYNVNMTIYDSEGEIVNSYTYDNDNNWISWVPYKAETFTLKADITGDITGSVSKTFKVSYDAGISSENSSIALNLNCTTSKTTKLTPTGGYPGRYGFAYGIDDESIVSCSWGNWDGDSIYLNINAKNEAVHI